MGNNRDASKAAAIKVTSNITGDVTHVIIPAILQAGLSTGGETLTSASGSYETCEFVVRSDSNLKYTRMEINNPNDNMGETIRFVQGGKKNASIFVNNTTGKFYIQVPTENRMIITPEGYVGIGEDSPGYRLHVWEENVVL